MPGLPDSRPPAAPGVPRAALEAFACHLFEAVYVLDRRRRIIYWSEEAARISGFTADEVLGRRCSDNILMHVDEAGTPLCTTGCPMARTLSDGQPRELNVYLHHKEGHRVPVRIRAGALRAADGSIEGTFELFTDDVPRSVMEARVQELEQMAMLDQLTQLPNRRFLDRILESRIQEQARYGWGFGVLLMDIDHFKRVNDTWGHDAGDAVLRVVAATLRSSGRVFDAVGRWGGEEFLAVLARVDEETLLSVAERFRNLIQGSRARHEGQELRVTVSIGCALGRPEDDAKAVTKRADELLYRAKREGRNRALI